MQDTELPEKIEPISLNFQTELAAKLAKLVPETLSDGKLDVTKLREMVNGDAENSPEKFGLFWPGKRAAQALAQIPTTATLVPAPDESEDWDNTKNIFIEGDNLEVLKALQNSYRRKIKMIYIDPPYNTGKEFIYPDKFAEGLQGYLEYTGQKNEAGESIESKPETGGRKHSNWLSMMYPRLQLAKSLLSDDGVIFISIDDNEQSNLKKLADEVFGEDNFIAMFIHKNNSSKNQAKLVSVSTEYFLCYARNTERLREVEWRISKKGVDDVIALYSKLREKSLDLDEILSEVKELYSRPKYAHLSRWNKIDEKGVFMDADLSREGGAKNYTIANPHTGQDCLIPQRGWGKSQEELQRLQSADLIYYGDSNTPPRMKQYLESDSKSVPDNFWYFDNSVDTRWVKNEFGALVFENPKPLAMIQQIINLHTSDGDIVVDFFSGSGTTAHAVMAQNAQDGFNRRHIQVQLPELTQENAEAFKLGYKTIADVSKERIRRAGKKIREDYTDKIAQRSTPLDTGFRVYKLAPSNFVQWDESKAKDDIQQSVLDFAANKKPDAVPESLLTEIMLHARVPLSANIEKRELQSGGWVYVVDGGNLIAYVADEQITEAQANEIADLAPAKLIVLDSAFNGNNALKINVTNICKEKFIKEFKTI